MTLQIGVLLTTPAPRARACARAKPALKLKKNGFFLRIGKISYRHPDSVLKLRFFWIDMLIKKNEKLFFFATRRQMCYIGYARFARMGSIALVGAALPRVRDHNFL